jgi:hypothetical protein
VQSPVGFGRARAVLDLRDWKDAIAGSEHIGVLD